MCVPMLVCVRARALMLHLCLRVASWEVFVVNLFLFYLLLFFLGEGVKISTGLCKMLRVLTKIQTQVMIMVMILTCHPNRGGMTGHELASPNLNAGTIICLTLRATMILKCKKKMWRLAAC